MTWLDDVKRAYWTGRIGIEEFERTVDALLRSGTDGCESLATSAPGALLVPDAPPFNPNYSLIGRSW